MQPAVTPPRASWRGWIGRNPALATGTFLSAVFIIVGLAGTVVFFPRFRLWLDSAEWPTAEATITASEIVYRSRSRGGRPEFTFDYQWQGRTYTARGYDLVGAYTSGTGGRGPHTVINAHPVGSRVTVWVNPQQPGQAVMVRGTTGGLILLAVPPLFFLLGLIGAFFTVISGLGWLDRDTRNPLGRVIRAGGGWFLQEKVLKPFFFVVVGAVIVGLVALGIAEGEYLMVGVGIFIAWGVWRAARPPRRAGRQ